MDSSASPQSILRLDDGIRAAACRGAPVAPDPKSRPRLTTRKLRYLPALACLCAALAASPRAARAQDAPPNEESQAKQFGELLDATKQMGPWENQTQLNEDAAALVFQRQGWTSEQDQYALNLMREVDRIPPWQNKQRQEVFLSSLQSRYHLTENQKAALDKRMQAEVMKITVKYFKDVAPIAMEAIKTRAAGQPYSPDQIARWSRMAQPIMDEGKQALERVANSMAETMTPEQRKLMDADLKAFQKRHSDVVKMVDRWQRGEWDPRDWGLDRDPIHAPIVAAKVSEQTRAAYAAAAAGQQAAQPPARPEDESSWERYVREFGLRNGFDEVQTKSARAILSEQTARAKNFRQARATQIAALERSIASAADPALKAERSRELQSVLEPVSDMFNEMCSRLDELLTAEQRARNNPRPTPSQSTRIPTH